MFLISKPNAKAAQLLWELAKKLGVERKWLNKYIICLSLSIVLFSCEQLGLPKNLSELDAIFSKKSPLQQPAPTQGKEVVGDPKQEIVTLPNSKQNICTVTKYRAAPEYNEMMLLDPTTDLFYPGAIIEANSLTTGKYKGLFLSPGYRKPLRFSASLQNIKGSPVATMQAPSLSNFRDARNKILSQELNGDVPALITFVNKSVYSEEHLAVALDAHYAYNGAVKAKINGFFNFNKSRIKSRIILKYTQRYYTLDIDLPGSADDLIHADAISDTDMKKIREMESDAAYISSMTYGRMALFGISSSVSETNLKAALNASVESVNQEASINISMEQKMILNSAIIQGTIIGGSSQAGAKAIIGYQSMMKYITEGGKYSKDSPGAPLVAKIRNMRNHEVTNFVKMSEYNVRSCTARKTKEKLRGSVVKIENVRSDDPGKSSEYYGYIDIDVYDKKTDRAVSDRTYIATDGKYPWESSASSPSEIRIGGAKNYSPGNQSVTLTVPTPNASSYSDYYVLVIAEFTEHDDSDDDYVGYYSENIGPLAEFVSGKKPHSWRMSGDGSVIRISIEIEPVN